MIDHNNKNFILAIVLSMAIIFGWQYFYAIPIAEQARQETTTAQPNTTTTPTTTAQVPGAATAVTPVTRDQALTTSPRLKIETPELQGSINLTGAQLDDPVLAFLDALGRRQDEGAPSDPHGAHELGPLPGHELAGVHQVPVIRDRNRGGLLKDVADPSVLVGDRRHHGVGLKLGHLHSR